MVGQFEARIPSGAKARAILGLFTYELKPVPFKLTHYRKQRWIEGGVRMPAYEYLCGACGSHFERRQKMSDAAIEDCPECGGGVKRLISGGAGAITKGSSSPAGAEPRGMCGMGGPCCGQGGGCGNPGFCEN